MSQHREPHSDASGESFPVVMAYAQHGTTRVETVMHFTPAEWDAYEAAIGRLVDSVLESFPEAPAAPAAAEAPAQPVDLSTVLQAAAPAEVAAALQPPAETAPNPEAQPQDAAPAPEAT